MKQVTIKLISNPHDNWAPGTDTEEFEILKKDELRWIDWPVYFTEQPNPEENINLKIALSFTGGSLKGEEVTLEKEFETKLQPFIDIIVDYPIRALNPKENNKLYGRESLLRTLKNSFTSSGQTRMPFLEGVRKVGKTSILFFLATRLTKEKLPVFVNFDKTWDNPYQLIAQSVVEELVKGNKLYNEDVQRVGGVDDLYRFLADITSGTGIKHIILMLDEFHVVVEQIANGSVSSRFLGDLRDMYMNRQQNISLVFADWHLIDELKAQAPAQLWTDFVCEPVSFLNQSDCREAVLLPAKGSSVHFDQDVVSRIYYWTSGYPWHIQWICSELIKHLNDQMRYVAIPKDINDMSENLLKQDRYFNEGICRPERLTEHSQKLIYELLERLNKKEMDISAWFPRKIIEDMKFPFDVKRELGRLINLQIFQEEALGLRFCSPLHAKWFNKKRQQNNDVYKELFASQDDSIANLPHITVPDNPEQVIREKCDELKILKSKLRTTLLTNQIQIFTNVEMPEEWKGVSIMVNTQVGWETFIKALRKLLVEDMVEKLTSWAEKNKYPKLYEQLESIRRRRNFIEHNDSEEGREEEKKCCKNDIGKSHPTSSRDWIVLQICVLDRLKNAFDEAIEHATL